MSKLIKDFGRDVVRGQAGRKGIPGSPATPGYWATIMTAVYPAAIMPSFGNTASDVNIDDINSERGKHIASYAEVKKIPELVPYANDVAAGLDPEEVRWKTAVYAIIQREADSGVLGRSLYDFPVTTQQSTNPQYMYVPYLAVWSTMTGQGAAIFRFTGYTKWSRPKLYLNPSNMDNL